MKGEKVTIKSMKIRPPRFQSWVEIKHDKVSHYVEIDEINKLKGTLVVKPSPPPKVELIVKTMPTWRLSENDAIGKASVDEYGLFFTGTPIEVHYNLITKRILKKHKLFKKDTHIYYKIF